MMYCQAQHWLIMLGSEALQVLTLNNVVGGGEIASTRSTGTSSVK